MSAVREKFLEMVCTDARIQLCLEGSANVRLAALARLSVCFLQVCVPLAAASSLRRAFPPITTQV